VEEAWLSLATKFSVLVFYWGNSECFADNVTQTKAY
jgi:hypothetical protein